MFYRTDRLVADSGVNGLCSKWRKMDMQGVPVRFQNSRDRRQCRSFHQGKTVYIHGVNMASECAGKWVHWKPGKKKTISYSMEAVRFYPVIPACFSLLPNSLILIFCPSLLEYLNFIFRVGELLRITADISM